MGTRDRKPKQNNASEIHRQAVENIPEQYLRCRAVNHPWRVTDVDEFTTGQVRYIQHYVCPICGTYRKQKLDKFGDTVTNHYQYPANYRFAVTGGVDIRDRHGIKIRNVRVEIRDLRNGSSEPSE